MTNKLDKWLNLSLRAPSGDNCQPWQFTFFEDRFVISIDEDRARHFLDQNFSGTWISIGCLCENLRLSAPSFGFSCEFTLETDHSVTVSYKNVQEKIDEGIRDAISHRQTYRGKLNSVEFDLSKYRTKFAGEMANSKFEWKAVPGVSRSLMWNWSWLESVLWLRTSLMNDFTKWIRFKTDLKDDGLTLENLHVSVSDQISLVGFKKFPKLIKFVPFSFFKFKSFLRLNFLVKNSAGLLLLTGPFANYRDYFFAGKEIQRMWIFMTENNIKAQPLAIQSLFFNFLESNSNRQFLTADQIEKIRKVKENTFQELEINRNLVFSFRFGSTKNEMSFLPRRFITAFGSASRKRA